MTIFVLSLVGGVLLAAATGNATEIRREWKDLTVTVEDADGTAGPPRVSLQRAGSLSSFKVDLTGTAIVDDVLFQPPARVIVRGRMSRQYVRDEVFTLIDTNVNAVLDSFRTRDAVVSPDERTVAYQWRTPDQTGRVALLPALLAYDFTAPLAKSRTSNVPDSDAGTILYPDENRSSQQYVIVLDPADSATWWMSGGRPGRGFVSSIAWSPDSTRLAVVEHIREAGRLVLIDVSDGLRQPSVQLLPVPRELFLPSGSPGLSEFLSQFHYPDDTFVAFEELRFGEDGQTITMKPVREPWVEKTITLEAPPANQ